jgi:hypothetical protein
MYDINPLGPMMHLKELDRQAAQRLGPVPSTKQAVCRVASFSAWIALFLRGCRAAGIPRRVRRKNRGIREEAWPLHDGRFLPKG